jgi:hypothetical protein
MVGHALTGWRVNWGKIRAVTVCMGRHSVRDHVDRYLNRSAHNRAMHSLHLRVIGIVGILGVRSLAGRRMLLWLLLLLLLLLIYNLTLNVLVGTTVDLASM